jgi:O-antigen ligase
MSNTMDSQRSVFVPSQWTKLSPGFFFAVTLAVAMFVSADALFPLLVSGGQEMDIDTSATAHVRTLAWMLVFLMFAMCFAVSWRGLMAAIRENLLFVLLIGFAFVSAIWSDSPLRAAYSAAQLGVLTLFALTVAYRLPLERALLVACLTYAAMTGLSLAMIVARPDLGISSSIMYEGAWRGIFIHKNHFGTQLSLAFAAFFAAFVLMSGRIRWLWAMLLLVTVALSFKSRSSTALLTCLAIPTVYLVLRATRLSRSMIYGVIGFVLAGGSIAVAILAGNWSAILEAIGKDPDLSGRAGLWSMIFDSIASRPVLGFGYDSFWSSTASDGGAAITRSVVWSPGGAHNGWIELTTQLGLAGLAWWLAVFLRTVGLAARWCVEPSRKRDPLGLWPVLTLVVVVTWSLVESNVMRHANSVHFMFSLITGYLVHLDTGTIRGRDRGLATKGNRAAGRPSAGS